jgi:hypothetical protein
MSDRCDASQQLTKSIEKSINLLTTHLASHIVSQQLTSIEKSLKLPSQITPHNCYLDTFYLSPTRKQSHATMNKTAQDAKDDIDIYEESSCSESSQTLPGSPQEGEVAQEGKMKDRIIKKEEKAVRSARLLVIAAVIACAVATSTAIYIFASNSDQSTFELEVSNNRHTLLQHRTPFP